MGRHSVYNEEHIMYVLLSDYHNLTAKIIIGVDAVLVLPHAIQTNY